MSPHDSKSGPGLELYAGKSRNRWRSTTMFPLCKPRLQVQDATSRQRYNRYAVLSTAVTATARRDSCRGMRNARTAFGDGALSGHARARARPVVRRASGYKAGYNNVEPVCSLLVRRLYLTGSVSARRVTTARSLRFTHSPVSRSRMARRLSTNRAIVLRTAIEQL